MFIVNVTIQLEALLNESFQRNGSIKNKKTKKHKQSDRPQENIDSVHISIFKEPKIFITRLSQVGQSETTEH